MKPAPLAGYRVLELSSAAAGPLAAAILADQGADVIKIEPPTGDFMRGIGTMRNGVAAVFAALNRNKRSVAIDLQHPAGRAMLHRLVPTADVLIHNLRPDVAERLGAGFDELRALRPELVYVAINGWGTSGPAVRDAAYDSIIQAACGLARHQGGNARPTFIRTVVCDKAT
ncbi:MAG TPA: CoA transferase, partial [Acidimicrobiales bacterium]